MMKNILVFLFLLCVTILKAQEGPDLPKYNAKNAANLFYYNLSEVPEKIKVKKDVIENKTLKALRNYNYKVKKISFLKTPELTDLEVTVNTLGKKLYTDRDLAQKIRKRIENLIIPLRDTIAVYEKSLNDTLQSFLSKKQNKKWLKYQKAQKRKLLPKRPKNRNNTAAPPTNMNRRRGGGFGGRRF